MADFRVPVPEADSRRTLPSGFISIRDILQMDPNKVAADKPFVDVICLVRDYQPPRSTSKSDWKMTLTVVDLSIDKSYEEDIMKVNIFRPEQDMPQISVVAQPVLIRKVKVQIYFGVISLLTSFQTEIHVFPAQIPKWPIASNGDLPKSTGKGGKINADEANYVAWLQNHIDRDAFPTAKDFSFKANQASNIRDKYKELREVKAGEFCDLIGEIIKLHETAHDKVTVYLSDYTINEQFYHHTIPGYSVSDGRDGDTFGYLNGKAPRKGEKENEWPGPYGKMTIQLTAFDNHGKFLKEYAKVGSWVKLTNVRMAFGRDGGVLEAKLHRDRGAEAEKIQVQILNMPEDPGAIDPRWKSAIRRKRDYYNKVEKLKRQLEEHDEGAIGKRKHNDEEPAKMNGRKRRKERRKALALKAAQEELRGADKDVTISQQPEHSGLELNNAVSTKHLAMTPVTLTQILAHRLPVQTEGVSFLPPFTNANYRANIRITDFFPHTLADFSVGRKASEFDCLSDASSASEDDDMPPPRGDIADYMHADGESKRWTWRFALQVEDATSPDDAAEKSRIWLLVDNNAGQFLLNADAINLRTDAAELANLREKLFLLWGDLEERKSKYLASAEGKLLLSRSFAKDKKADSPSPSPSPSPTPQAPRKPRPGDQPPDSDDETASPALTTSVKDTDPLDAIRRLRPAEAGARLAVKLREIGEQVQNKPFTACIREYGVKVPVTDDADTAMVGTDEGWKWQRMFGLFDTIIL